LASTHQRHSKWDTRGSDEIIVITSWRYSRPNVIIGASKNWLHNSFPNKKNCKGVEIPLVPHIFKRFKMDWKKHYDTIKIGSRVVVIRPFANVSALIGKEGTVIVDKTNMIRGYKSDIGVEFDDVVGLPKRDLHSCDVYGKSNFCRYGGINQVRKI